MGMTAVIVRIERVAGGVVQCGDERDIHVLRGSMKGGAVVRFGGDSERGGGFGPTPPPKKAYSEGSRDRFSFLAFHQTQCFGLSVVFLLGFSTGPPKALQLSSRLGVSRRPTKGPTSPK